MNAIFVSNSHEEGARLVSDVGVDTVAAAASSAAWRLDAHVLNGRMEKRPAEPVDRKRRGNGESSAYKVYCCVHACLRT